MTGWAVAIALAIATLCGILLFAPMRTRLWPTVAAAVVLALAGYAWQGRPGVSSAPAQVSQQQRVAADTVLKMRANMDASYGAGKQWLILADSYARRGNYSYAAAAINGALKRYPRDGDLWAGLGTILYLAGENRMSQPAAMAFANARKFNPANRAPDYFDGLTSLLEGRPLDTIAKWQQMVDNAPDKAVWKPRLESQLNQLKAIVQATQPMPPK